MIETELRMGRLETVTEQDWGEKRTRNLTVAFTGRLGSGLEIPLLEESEYETD